jgi:hypothetical protein
MGIARFETVNVNNVSITVDDIGQTVTNISLWFQTRARVMDIKEALHINKDDRIYSDTAKFVLNNTPNTLQMAINQVGYSFGWRGQDWRISDVYEANDKMSITFLVYRNDPTTQV